MPLVLANTARGSLLVTDGNAAYLNLPDRRHLGKNLSERNALPAHITMKWIHRVFSNMQRWAMGTYHGLRDKHVVAYLDEFTFRWNRRRRVRTNVDTILGVGQRFGRTTWRDIVGDTSEWRHQHKDQVLARVGKERLATARAISRAARRDLFEVIDELRKNHRKARTYKRRPPKVPALPPRRPGEERRTARYVHPPRPPEREIALGVLRHIPKGSRLALP
jgi:ISXO2-like transposase domain